MDATPLAWRPMKTPSAGRTFRPSCTPWLPLIPRTRGLPTPSCPSHRSPLRSADCTAAPEGQTKVGFGKTLSGAILEILCTRARTAGSLASLVRGLAEVPSSHPPAGGRRAHRHPLKSRGSLWSRKDGRSETCPRPESPCPEPREPSTQAPPTQFPRSPRRRLGRPEPCREGKPAEPQTCGEPPWEF